MLRKIQIYALGDHIAGDSVCSVQLVRKINHGRVAGQHSACVSLCPWAAVATGTSIMNWAAFGTSDALLTGVGLCAVQTRGQRHTVVSQGRLRWMLWVVVSTRHAVCLMILVLARTVRSRCWTHAERHESWWTDRSSQYPPHHRGHARSPCQPAVAAHTAPSAQSQSPQH